MDYIRLSIHTTGDGIEPVIGALSMLGLDFLEIIEDESAIREHLNAIAGQWDYVDPAELLAGTGPCVRVYIPLEDDEGGARLAEETRLEIERLREAAIGVDLGPLRITQDIVREQDWANNWKQYFKPARIGKNIVICPSWEVYSPLPNDRIINIDPGMAFGTGTHETTSLCLKALEKHVWAGCRVLDVGCGSGILSVAACLLGASCALAVDIDHVAVGVARENAVLNGLTDKITCRQGDLLNGFDAGIADITVANIVADVILRLMPTAREHTRDGGIFITSGIIDEREEEIAKAAAHSGFTLLDAMADGVWRALVFRANKQVDEG